MNVETFSLSIDKKLLKDIREFCDKEDRQVCGFLRQAAREKLERVSDDTKRDC